MKNSHIYIKILSVLFALTLIFSVSFLTVRAADEPDAGDAGEVIFDDPVSDDTPASPGGDDSSADDTPADTPADDGKDAETPADSLPDNAEFVEDDDDDEPVAAYTAPEHLDELPAVSSEEVVLATTVPIPDIEVSDTSLLGGVIMWLCVAVGIAVIAGVMVSKRTKRKS